MGSKQADQEEGEELLDGADKPPPPPPKGKISDRKQKGQKKAQRKGQKIPTLLATGGARGNARKMVIRKKRDHFSTRQKVCKVEKGGKGLS